MDIQSYHQHPNLFNNGPEFLLVELHHGQVKVPRHQDGTQLHRFLSFQFLYPNNGLASLNHLFLLGPKSHE
jgi:hypothetical protein